MNDDFSKIELFKILKKNVETTFLQENSASNRDISMWKGQDIVNFQEDLRLKVKGQVSEKWFYTHIKSEVKKLPRVDMLNLLSRYCGFKGWNDFVQQQKNEIEIIENKTDSVVEKNEVIINEKSKVRRSFKLSWTSVLLLLGFLAALIYGIITFFNSDYYEVLEKGPIYKFSFINADDNKPINDLVEITIKAKGTAPHYKNTRNGSYSFHSKLDTVQMIVNSSYYKRDTFDLILSHYNVPQTIELQPDDYKLVWRYYLRSDVKVRRQKLRNTIHPNAQIYRVYEDNKSFIEPYTREEYINYLSLPNTNLENFEMIQSEKKQNKFIYIKFKIKETDEL